MWHANAEWHVNYGDEVKNETEKDYMTDWKRKITHWSYRFLTKIRQSVLLEIFCATNSISRKAASGRPRTVRTEQNIERVAELICSQEDNLGPAKVPEILKSWHEYPAVLCNESLRQICSIRSSDARRRTCCLILIIDQWRPRLKAVVQVRGRSIEQLFTWLSGCCTQHLDIGTSMHCCCVLPLWHNDVGVLWLCCNFFWTTCWHTKLVWASIYVGQNFSSQDMLFVNVNKYTSTINRKI